MSINEIEDTVLEGGSKLADAIATEAKAVSDTLPYVLRALKDGAQAATADKLAVYLMQKAVRDLYILLQVEDADLDDDDDDDC